MVQGAGGGANDLRSTLEEGHGVTARGSTGEPQKDDLHRMGPKPGAALQLISCYDPREIMVPMLSGGMFRCFIGGTE